MSARMTCPGCNSHLSDVLNAFEEGRPCPQCGLSAEAAAEITAIRRRRADEELKARLVTVIKERDEEQRNFRRASARLTRLSSLLAAATDTLSKPLRKEDDDWH